MLEKETNTTIPDDAKLDPKRTYLGKPTRADLPPRPFEKARGAQWEQWPGPRVEKEIEGSPGVLDPCPNCGSAQVLTLIARVAHTVVRCHWVCEGPGCGRKVSNAGVVGA